jgi:hypothetical protein
MMVAGLAMAAIAASYGGCGGALPPIRVNSDGTRPRRSRGPLTDEQIRAMDEHSKRCIKGNKRKGRR